MSVSPNGRIDAVWNDTRGSTDSTKSALDYSYSVDGGVTWSANEQASPKWDSTIGWPRQNKIGDYYHMISRNDGTDLAWAATFNGEEDVYFLRIPSTVTAASDRVPPLRMSGGRPNPFHGSTIIRFEMPKDGGRAFLAVFDPAGRRVATLVNGFVPGGAGSARWSGVDDAGRVVKSGLYLARLETAGRSETTKLMLLR
ncbi:MAG: T9SS type A sorting domain-containing protein [Candidatus Eisenbacteria bacterium]|uniref:T9SS type A sorting domain-containing protein n=1 Tax=Eiseniibacteriota bacterium TaxID=2212470 RepID=A0A538UB19_UNCEI|nr:MAG: T9SS type A sorting domain-containing protein [Candidatus Eisenbacteria bacterium]